MGEVACAAGPVREEEDAEAGCGISDRMERRNLTAEDRRRLVVRLGELLGEADHHGIALALEPCVSSMVYDTASALQLFGELPDLRMNYAASHLACIAEDPFPLIDAHQ